MAANSGEACRVMSGDAAARWLGPDVCRRAGRGMEVGRKEPERRSLATAPAASLTHKIMIQMRKSHEPSQISDVTGA